MRYIRLMAMMLSAGLLVLSSVGCHRTNTAVDAERQNSQKAETAGAIDLPFPDETIMELEEGLSMVAFHGNDGFEDFLAQGGASDDDEVVRFLVDNLGGRTFWDCCLEETPLVAAL